MASVHWEQRRHRKRDRTACWRRFRTAGFLLPLWLCTGSSSGPNDPDIFTPAERRHWAYQKIGHPALPQVKQNHWVRNPIDAFILAELEAKRLSPAPTADRVTLLRRATFDL